MNYKGIFKYISANMHSYVNKMLSSYMNEMLGLHVKKKKIKLPVNVNRMKEC